MRRHLLYALVGVGLVFGGAAADLAGTGRLMAAPQAAQTAPPAQPDGPRFIVTYVEVAPASQAEALTLMKAYRDGARREDGNQGAEVLQRLGPRGHFAVFETWRDESTWRTHQQATATAQFHEKLKAFRVSPYDERSHTGLGMGPVRALPDGAVLVVTHVDVIPPGHLPLRETLKSLAEASRKDAGNLRYDVLQGVKQNHFTLLEAWGDQRAYEAHASAVHTKTFREEHHSRAIDGCPYDERAYQTAK